MPYFLIVTSIGAFVVLNLFVVIMLSAFTEDVIDEEFGDHPEEREIADLSMTGACWGCAKKRGEGYQ